MVNVFFSNALAFFVNEVFLNKIVLHKSIWQGCPLAPYIYVFVVNALLKPLEQKGESKIFHF